MRNLKEIYGEEFARSMFVHDEAEYTQYQIVGKYCVISLEWVGNIPILDIWLTPKGRLADGFSSKKLTGMINAWKGDLGAIWVRLDGEAYVKTKNMQSIVDNRVLLGLKKKPEITQDRLDALNMQMANIHKIQHDRTLPTPPK